MRHKYFGLVHIARSDVLAGRGSSSRSQIGDGWVGFWRGKYTLLGRNGWKMEMGHGTADRFYR